MSKRNRPTEIRKRPWKGHRIPHQAGDWTVRVERYLNSGCGLARLESGEVVFIEDTLPGEIVRIQTLASRQRGVRMATRFERLSDSPDRREPACPHFGRCGGCQTLFVKPESEFSLKCQMLEDTLGRVGGIRNTSIHPVDFPFSPSRFRGRLHALSSGELGFRWRKSRRIEPIRSCPVMPEVMANMLMPLREVVRGIGFSGEIHFACSQDMQHGAWQGIGLVNRPAAWPHAIKDWPECMGLEFRDERRSERWCVGANAVPLKWMEHRPELEPSQFFQSNPASWPHFWHAVDDFCRQYQVQSLWDTHAGAGFLTCELEQVQIFTSETDARGVAIQPSLLGEHLVNAFSGPAEVFCREQSKVLEDMDGVLINPPRVGASSELLMHLIHHPVRAILMVSCDMATMARDLRVLSERYRVNHEVLALNVSPGTLRLEAIARCEL